MEHEAAEATGCSKAKRSASRPCGLYSVASAARESRDVVLWDWVRNVDDLEGNTVRGDHL